MTTTLEFIVRLLMQVEKENFVREPLMTDLVVMMMMMNETSFCSSDSSQSRVVVVVVAT